MSICGATDTPVLDFLVTSPLGFKARVGSALFELCGGVRDIRSLRFTSGATHLLVYKASIAASHLPHMRWQTVLFLMPDSPLTNLLVSAL